MLHPSIRVKVVRWASSTVSGYERRAPEVLAMRKRRSPRSYEGEIHRYFPEWADLPVEEGMQWESDRNSYSAGGYAEEFGYAAQPGLPAPARPLKGDPECSKQWHCLIGALHPGYPECSRPL